VKRQPRDHGANRVAGTRPDAELAKPFGLTEHAMRQKRSRLDIPIFLDRRTRAAEAEVNGKLAVAGNESLTAAN
jgi:hypothetical protein